MDEQQQENWMHEIRSLAPVIEKAEFEVFKTDADVKKIFAMLKTRALAEGHKTNTAQETEPMEVVEEVVPASDDGVLSDEDLAAQYRSQADAMFKEAKRLREQAEELVPTKRKKKAEAEA